MQLNLFRYYRFHNKGVYVKASLKNMSKSNMANLQDRLQLTVDGLDVPLPNLEGLCVLNICLLYTSPSPRDKRQSRMPSSA